jgi:hypothetical protein
MVKVNSAAIKDFQTCELLYDYRHAQKMPEAIVARNILSEKFENTLKSVINFYLYKKQSGLTPSYAALLNRWEKLWFPKDVSAQDIINDRHESAYGNMASLTTKAAGILLSFCNFFEDETIIPIGIAEEYNVPVGKSIINDEFDLIFSKNNQIHVIKWVFNYKDSHHYLYNVDFICMYYAYMIKNNGKALNNVKFGYYDIMAPKHSIQLLDIYKEDVDSIEYWVSTIEGKKVFAPRRGLTYYCKRCPFDTPCSKWSQWSKEG